MFQVKKILGSLPPVKPRQYYLGFRLFDSGLALGRVSRNLDQESLSYFPEDSTCLTLKFCEGGLSAPNPLTAYRHRQGQRYGYGLLYIGPD